MTDIEDYKAERTDIWAKIIDVIRDYRLMNMVDVDGENYPLVDLMTAEGCDIGDGENEMVALADEIHAVVESRITALEALAVELATQYDAMLNSEPSTSTDAELAEAVARAIAVLKLLEGV